jgi:hypothetical protein
MHMRASPLIYGYVSALPRWNETNSSLVIGIHLVTVDINMTGITMVAISMRSPMRTDHIASSVGAGEATSVKNDSAIMALMEF